jgi:hypothetical protein
VVRSGSTVRVRQRACVFEERDRVLAGRRLRGGRSGDRSSPGSCPCSGRPRTPTAPRVRRARARKSRGRWVDTAAATHKPAQHQGATAIAESEITHAWTLGGRRTHTPAQTRSRKKSLSRKVRRWRTCGGGHMAGAAARCRRRRAPAANAAGQRTRRPRDRNERPTAALHRARVGGRIQLGRSGRARQRSGHRLRASILRIR